MEMLAEVCDGRRDYRGKMENERLEPELQRKWIQKTMKHMCRATMYGAFFYINNSSIHLFNMNIPTNKTIAERINRLHFKLMAMSLVWQGFGQKWRTN